MPDKHPQDWTDDAAFYDEAWADMNGRLDRRRRRGLVWWCAGIAAVGLLLLLAWPALSLDTAAEHLTEVAAPLPREMAAKRAEAPPGTAPVVAEEINKKTLPTPASSPEQQLVSLKTKANEIDQSVPIVDQTVESAPSLIPATAPAPASPPPSVNRAETILPVAVLSPESTLRPLPGVTFPPASPALKVAGGSSTEYFVEASSLLSQRAGASLGIGARLRTDRRLSIPLTLRARLDRLAAVEETTDQAAVPEITLDSLGAPTNQSAVMLSELRTYGLELETGLSYRLHPRLRLQTTAGLTYLVGGSVGISQTDGSIPLVDQGESFNNQVFSDLRSGGGTADLALGRGILTGNGGESPRFSRWRTRLGVSLQYGITPRWRMTAGYTYLVNHAERSQRLRFERGQVSFGFRYQLR